MKTLHFDCFAGISGDMTLGALVDLGVDRGELVHELEKLGLEGWKLDFVRDERNGVTGTRAIVDTGENHHAHHDHDHDHEHEHDHDHDHEHEHSHEHEHDHGHSRRHEHHSHNSWKDIRNILEKSALREGAKKRAVDIFSRIAGAESRVHGVPVDDVAFHEVGAMDSIIDIAGAAICLDLLAPDMITASEIELGGGTVKCAHGILPAPAPATVLLVQGLPVKTGGFNREMTTPTGAAILAASVDRFIVTGEGSGIFRELKTGTGIGARKMDKPNILRVSLRETAEAVHPGWKSENLVLLEANIDDMTGEELGFLMERFFEEGALDVTFTPLTMKKSRPGTLVSVLGRPEKTDVFRGCFFRYSSTIGFREIPVNRVFLGREEKVLKGAFGEAAEKTVFTGKEPLRSKIEFEDRARVARERHVTLGEADRIIREEAGGGRRI
ncbi:MAG: nickel pincer cofactor biosynthesis protein LarC [Treponema sp.]|nr:nickel pincer cofactor biosynthesis protein LarC [Treponema sp.]